MSLPLAEFDPRTSILLLGAGFSRESRNLLGKAPPTGNGLREHFIEALSLPAGSDYSLPVLAEEFGSANEDGLFQEIYNLFHIKEVSASQGVVLEQPWHRIYTTNFDNTVEAYHHPKQPDYPSYVSADLVPIKLQESAIIHLHGSVTRLTADRVLEQIVLGETSYVQQYISRSPWYTQFQGDLRFASAVFVVGYSLSDYHISALLLENPSLAERTFFVQPTTQDPIFVRRTERYGRAAFIGLDGFASFIKQTPRTQPSSDFRRLRSFKYLDPQKDKKALVAPTAPEVLSLLMYGTFNYSRAAATLPNPTYVTPRASEVQTALDGFSTSRTLLVDSRLGNGKTIFMYLLFLRLAQDGWNCFWFRSGAPTFSADLQAIARLSKAAVFFEDYAAAQDIIQQVGAAAPSARLIVEIRTSILEVRYHEVRQAIPRPFGRVTLNRLSEEDFASFRELCIASGVPTSALTQKRPMRDLRDVLLSILESDVIRKKIDATISPVFASASKRRVLLLTMLLSRYHLSADAGFVRTVTGVDPFHEFQPAREVADDLFETSSDNFRVRSAIFSEFAVHHLISPDEVGSCLVDAALAAAERKSDRTYRILMSNLMQFSNMEDMFKRVVGHTGLIAGLYERLRHDDRINDEPLFWLQYALAMAADGKLLEAETYIATSYERAERRSNFRTHQIDTQALRIYLLIETDAKRGEPVSRLARILSLLEKVDVMLGEESHRGYVIKVVEHICPFSNRRAADLSTSERIALIFWLNRIATSIGALPLEYRVQYATDASKADVERAISYLK